MKKLLGYNSTYRDKSQLLELNIEVLFLQEIINSSTILDLNDSAFYDFEANILLACELRDFELEDSYQSNRPDSVSQYYIYKKENEDGTKLKVLLKLRVSDHEAPDRTFQGKHVSQKKLSQDYIKEEAQQLAKSQYNQKREYRARVIDIVLDDEHFNSYEEALREIEDKLDEFDPYEE